MINKKALTIAFGLILLLGEAGFTQSPAPNKKKKMTVGELLKKAKEDSRGGQVNLLEKGNTNLPSAKLAFDSSHEPVNLSRVKPPRSS